MISPCTSNVIVLSARCKRSPIDGLSQPCMKHRRAESSHHIGFIIHRAQHQGCLHYVSMRGDERASFEGNGSSNGRSAPCHCAWRQRVNRNLIKQLTLAVLLLRTNGLSSLGNCKSRISLCQQGNETLKDPYFISVSSLIMKQVKSLFKCFEDINMLNPQRNTHSACSKLCL